VKNVARIGEMRNAYNILVGRRRHRWEDNIKMDLREIGWEIVEWTHLAHGRGQ